MRYRHLRKKLPGFTLIELAIALVVVGMIVGTVFMGAGKLINSAKVRALISDIDQYRFAVLSYRDQYGFLPGDDPYAQEHFGVDGVVNGDGNSQLEGDKRAQFWVHLAKAELLPDATPPAPKLGGQFSVSFSADADQRGNWLVLGVPSGGGETNGSLLTPQQARDIKSRLGGGKTPSDGPIRVVNGAGGAECLNGGQYRLETKSAACKLMIRLE